jgi:hypothetical protein
VQLVDERILAKDLTPEDAVQAGDVSRVTGHDLTQEKPVAKI